MKYSVAAALLVTMSMLASGAQAVCDNLSARELLGMSLAPGNDSNSAADEVKENVNTASAVAQSKMAQIATSLSTPGVFNGNTTENFLPLLSLFGLGPVINPNNNTLDDDLIGFDLNLPFIGGRHEGRELKIALAVAREPTVFSPLINSIEESQRSAVQDRLTESLDSTDDSLVALTYNFNTQKLGRYQSLVGGFFGHLNASIDSTALRNAFDAYSSSYIAFSNVFGHVRPDVVIADLPVPAGADSDAANEVRRRYCASGREFAAENSRWEARANSVINEANIDAVAQLASNQPQLHFTVAKRNRSSAAGPDETLARLTFEWGYRANMTKLEGQLYRTCNGDSVGTCMLDGYRDYLSTNADKIKAQDRLSLSLEYVDVDAYRFEDTEQGIQFGLPSARKFIGRMSLGHTIGRGRGQLSGVRVEFGLSYEDVDDDDTLNDRAIASLTLTKQVDNIAIPIGLVYSNKPEYVTMNTDARVSARLGIKYNFDVKD